MHTTDAPTTDASHADASHADAVIPETPLTGEVFTAEHAARATPITVAEINDRWLNRTLNYCDATSEQQWEDLFLEPVERFGLHYCLRGLDVIDASTPTHDGFARWYTQNSPLPPPAEFPLERITCSLQPGVLIGVVHHVLEGGTHRAPIDPEGMYANPHPILLLRADGTAIVSDGNHRVCGGRLRREKTITAHAIPYDFDSARYRWPDVDYQA